MSEKKILYVEDDLSLIEGLKYTLEKNGFLVDNARTVKEAYQFFQAGRYDLLLLDYQKPDQKYVEELLGILGLKERRKHLPSQLSGGQQQRVAIGRALAARPAIIMADEPTGNLDSKNSQEVITLLKSMSAKYRQTILMITHNENHADATDRVLRMTDGRLRDLGVAAR